MKKSENNRDYINNHLKYLSTKDTQFYNILTKAYVSLVLEKDSVEIILLNKVKDQISSQIFSFL